MTGITLYELNQRVRGTLSSTFREPIWLCAELSDVRTNGPGHCYLEFIEKSPQTNQLIAKARGVIWANTYRSLRPYFESATGQLFTSGIKVMVAVTVEFHELYGYSLTVRNIDPSYTLGDMAQRRKEILKQLTAEGIIDINKSLPMPLLPQRIAVVSAPTAAGYGDFCNQLLNNPYGFVFYPRLFPAIMQGNQVESSIIGALDEISSQQERWDAVVIIRGGGATSDLSGFDTYPLAAACAQFPLPIITGIGHERDDTVIDAVSHTRVKTPTAAAEYLISKVLETAQQVGEWKRFIEQSVLLTLTNEQHRVERIAQRLPQMMAVRKMREEQRLTQLLERMTAMSQQHVATQRHRLETTYRELTAMSQQHVVAQRHHLEMASRELKAMSQQHITIQRHRLEMLGKEMRLADPQVVLKRGYSITLRGGKAVTNPSQLLPGDEVETMLAEGRMKSKVI